MCCFFLILDPDVSSIIPDESYLMDRRFLIEQLVADYEDVMQSCNGFGKHEELMPNCLLL